MLFFFTFLWGFFFVPRVCLISACRYYTGWHWSSWSDRNKRPQRWKGRVRITWSQGKLIQFLLQHLLMIPSNLV